LLLCEGFRGFPSVVGYLKVTNHSWLIYNNQPHSTHIKDCGGTKSRIELPKTDLELSFEMLYFMF